MLNYITQKVRTFALIILGYSGLDSHGSNIRRKFTLASEHSLYFRSRFINVSKIE